MSALLTSRSHTGALTPIDVPRLRAVSNRARIDVPKLSVTPPERVELRAVPDVAPVRETDVNGMERLVGAIKVGIIASASVAFAFGLELWLTF
ncbi:hypothetical protein [Flaviflexus huanghaiensis]|uniref:hypothetical protein n=1 Tax=Flaviflexus huanghaiensis TaxID=1111473 RepID=UPI0015FBCC16|nr:hypothetical protein [Flaviflexus huanghaiensis]